MVEIYICSKSYIWSAVFGSALDKSEIPIWFSQSDGTNPLVQIVFPTTGVKWNTTATTEKRTELQTNKLQYFNKSVKNMYRGKEIFKRKPDPVKVG